MDKKHTSKKASDKALIERLNRLPHLRERVESILELAESDEQKAFDEVEELLIEEVRKLGNETMGSWASRQESLLAKELREGKVPVQQREKKR